MTDVTCLSPTGIDGRSSAWLPRILIRTERSAVRVVGSSALRVGVVECGHDVLGVLRPMQGVVPRSGANTPGQRIPTRGGRPRFRMER